MKPAGLILDDSRHYIDHLAPFCSLQGWPLITCTETVANLARRYYPELEVIEANYRDLKLPPILVTCHTKAWIESAFGVDSTREILWLPHGNSDKGWNCFSFEALREETALVYGQKMIDFMEKKNVHVRRIRVGNFRLHYWQKHRLFYDALVKKGEATTYLYAPTWNDIEDNGTLWSIFPLIAKHLQKKYNLIVKIHPNTQRKYEPEIERLIGQYEKQSNILFLSEFPPIYPLLQITDVYIGDMSSIGYDFLYWNRPMFFLNAKKLKSEDNPSLFLYRCGIEVFPEEIASIFCPQNKDDLRFKKIRKQIYDYTFDACDSFPILH